MARAPIPLAVLAVLVLSAAACPALAADQKPAAPGVPAEAPQRLLYPARGLPAKDLARALSEHFGGRIQAVPTEHLVLLSFPAALAADVTRTLEALDRPPAMVEIDVLLAEVRTAHADAGAGDAAPGEAAPTAEKVLQDLPGWRKSGRVLSSYRVRLTTLDSQQASVQAGGSRPFTTGLSASRGIATQSITYRDLGVVVEVTPRVQGDAVLVNLNVSDSGQRAADTSPPGGGSETGGPGGAGRPGGAAADDVRPPAPEFTNSRIKSTLRLTPGRPVLVSSLRAETKARDTLALAVVTARILGAGKP